MNFERYIYQTMKALGLKQKIKKTAMKSMNSICTDIFKTIASEAGKLVEHNKLKTLGANLIESAIKMCIPAKMAKFSISNARKAC